MGNVQRPDLSAMATRWPSAIVAREEIENFSGGLVTSKYISILDSQGRGPADRVRVGRKVAYPIMSLIRWLEGRSEILS